MKSNLPPRLTRSQRSVVDLHHGLQIDGHPGFFADRPTRTSTLPRGASIATDTVTTCDARRASSHKTTRVNDDLLTGTRTAIALPTNDDKKLALEPNIFFEWRPVFHRASPPANGVI